ncbi:dATP/dGTP diphosphohydrolase domain-containing protein [Faecalibacterium tardum]|uniref:dATP/dGTP diphosphohydrolase domain-containing protein n=1 Tax=Faecalibacterium tardum TaxID=3133156 RepID=A0ABV1AT13_9FIRM
MIKDSGDRTEFETGAKRDMHAGKGRMDLLPWYGIMEVSKHCEEGALKYGEHNVDKGIPLHSLLDSASRHLAKYMVGMDDEDHLRAACWNLLWALNQRVTHPELDDRFCVKVQKEAKKKKSEWVAYPWRCKYCHHVFAEAAGYWTGENEVSFTCPHCGGIERWTPPVSPNAEEGQKKEDENVHCYCGKTLAKETSRGLKLCYPEKVRLDATGAAFLRCPDCDQEIMVLHPVWDEMGGIIV